MLKEAEVLVELYFQWGEGGGKTFTHELFPH
jgi:hypothetical protein